MKSTRLLPKHKLGQNTAEYMLLLLLIGGGSIMAFKTFGKGIMNRFASVTNIITGGTAIDGKDAQKKTDDIKDIDFGTFENEGKNQKINSAVLRSSGSILRLTRSRLL